MNGSGNMRSGPMPTASVVTIMVTFIASIAGLIFNIHTYRNVWLASTPEMDFSPAGIIFVPLTALFLILAIEVYFRNIARREQPPEWLYAATKYALIGTVLTLVLMPVVERAASAHLTAAGYVNEGDRHKSPGRWKWQKWEKVEGVQNHRF